MKENEVLLLMYSPYFEEVMQNYMKNTEIITINNKIYSISKSGIQKITLETKNSPTPLTVIVPDHVVRGMKEIGSRMNIQYVGNKKQNEEAINTLLASSNSGDFYDKYKFGLYGYTKSAIYEQEAGYRTMVTYIGIYLGLVFLMASATVLGLQQLAEASENLERYTILKKIGVGKQAIHKAIFAQIFIYFMMPLSLAIIHSFVGIPIASNEIVARGQRSILLPSLFAASIIIGIYGMYFIATYKSYKNIVK
ncbi:MAG: hypothetical protein ACI35O_01100 [Bacillaceae bacterium]